MLDRNKIGHRFPVFTAHVEIGRLKFFAKAIGETNPIYCDESAAREAGYKTLPAPPTFPMVLDMEGPEFLPIVQLLDMDLSRVLHGSQEFDYLSTLYAGDTITVTSQIKDIFDKKAGALEFVVLESHYINQDGEPVARTTQTIVYRNT